MMWHKIYTIAMILFHFCTICEVLNEDEAITFKISSDDELCEVYATATSSLSAGDTIASTTTTTTTTTVLQHFVRDYSGEPVPEETFTHPPSWSSSNLYRLLPSTTIHSILPVQITCLAVFLHNLCPRPLAQLLVITAGLHVKQSIAILECGPMPNVMAALLNIRGALC